MYCIVGLFVDYQVYRPSPFILLSITGLIASSNMWWRHDLPALNLSCSVAPPLFVPMMILLCPLSLHMTVIYFDFAFVWDCFFFIRKSFIINSCIVRNNSLNYSSKYYNYLGTFIFQYVRYYFWI